MNQNQILVNNGAIENAHNAFKNNIEELQSSLDNVANTISYVRDNQIYQSETANNFYSEFETFKSSFPEYINDLENFNNFLKKVLAEWGAETSSAASAIQSAKEDLASATIPFNQ